MTAREVVDALYRYVEDNSKLWQPHEFEGPPGLWYSEHMKNLGYDDYDEMEFAVYLHLDEGICPEYNADSEEGRSFTSCPFVVAPKAISPTQVYDYMQKLPEHEEGIVVWRIKPEKTRINVNVDSVIDRVRNDDSCRQCLSNIEYPLEMVYTRIFYATGEEIL